MLRALLETVLPFLAPFALYAIWVTLGRRYPAFAVSWTRGPVAALVVTGLAFAVATLLLVGLFGPRSRGAYVPAHLENGRLVPGRME